MKGATFVMVLLVFTSGGVVSAVGQTSRQEAAANARAENDLLRRMQDMRALESYAHRRSEKDRREMESINPPGLDKKGKERVRKMRMLDTRDIERYKTFLSGGKTGIFKIFPNFDCLSKNVVNIGTECSGFVPETSDFSFRAVAYTSRLFHDIGFERGEIISDSFFSQGIMTELGDVPIEDVVIGSAGFSYLIGFKPDALVVAAKQTARSIDAGINSDGFHYSGSVAPVANRTYVLRNIAYRFPNSLPPVNTESTLTDIKFKSLEMDTRDDLIVAFRVVRKDEDGGLTIVWKELSRRDAPKLKFGKGEAIADFK